MARRLAASSGGAAGGRVGARFSGRGGLAGPRLIRAGQVQCPSRTWPGKAVDFFLNNSAHKNKEKKY